MKSSKVSKMLKLLSSHDIDFSLRGNKCVDVQNIFHKKEQRNLSC
jgi:hypothetical protein